VIQAEDLLGVETMVNLPGTFDEHPNWRRRLPVSLADLLDDPRFSALSSLRERPPRAEPRKACHG
jgi:4-alpha-glucanotransferase